MQFLQCKKSLLIEKISFFLCILFVKVSLAFLKTFLFRVFICLIILGDLDLGTEIFFKDIQLIKVFPNLFLFEHSMTFVNWCNYNLISH